VARLQDHDDKPATALDWTTLLDEMKRAVRDFHELGETRDGFRIDELEDEIINRVNRAELRFPGVQRILGGEPL
jgi:hypothetical protein